MLKKEGCSHFFLFLCKNLGKLFLYRVIYRFCHTMEDEVV